MELAGRASLGVSAHQNPSAVGAPHAIGLFLFSLAPIAPALPMLLLIFTLVYYGREFISALGSYAVAAQIRFVLGMALVSDNFGFGPKQEQRSAMALGVCSRNGGAMFVAFTAFPNPDPGVLVMILLAVPVPFVVWLALARFFASRAGKLATRGAV